LIEMGGFACTSAFVAGVGVGAAVYYLYKTLKSKPSKIKVTYFDISATPGEKLRLALVLTVGKNGFEDDRVKFDKWPSVKESRKPKYGQMPIISIDGVDTYQSGSALRYFGSTLGDGSLYPVDDTAACMKIEEMIGLADDLQGAWVPSLYIGMRPGYLGHGDLEGAAKDAKVKSMREEFLANAFPQKMAFIEAELKATGAFIAGPKMTIADCQLFCQLNYFTKGVADHIPKTCLDAYPAITAYLARVKAIPAIKEWYGL